MQSSNGAERLPSLDGLRGISIILVVGAHAAGSISASLRPILSLAFNGDLGVRIFFVISGFIITTLLLNEMTRYGKIRLNQFYLRRFVRLAPVQLAFLTTLLLLTLTTQLRVTPCQFLTSITYTKNYACGDWIDGHLWSLSVEEQFYLIWPAAVAWLGARQRWRLAISFIILAPVFRVIFYAAGLSSLQTFSFMTNMDSLMIGCIAAGAWSSQSRHVCFILDVRIAGARAAALLAVYAVWLAQHFLILGKVTVPFGSTIQSLCIAFLILSLQRHPKGVMHRILNNRVLVAAGIISYSLYIWQQIFLVPAGLTGFGKSLVFEFPLNIAISVVVGIASYYILERPLNSLRRRLRPAEFRGKTEVLSDPTNRS